MKTLITSSGIIRDADSPRVGVVSQHSLSSDFLDTFMTDGIDIHFEANREETRAQIREENPDIDDAELDDRVDESMDMCHSDGATWLLGAWVRLPDGTYDIDRSGARGDFAAEYNSDTGNVCVNWSTRVVRCHHTSPCYVMADGRGPCGDLDTPGDSVLAYTLHEDCFRTEENDQ